jgi:hypothetical protein
MNELSWLIYLASVFNNIGIFFTIMGLLFVSAFIISCIVVAASREDKSNYNKIELKPYREEIKSLYKVLYIGLVAIFFGCVIPSRETVLLITASEISEKVLTSEKVNGIIDPTLDLIKQRIMNELNKYTNVDKK